VGERTRSETPDGEPARRPAAPERATAPPLVARAIELQRAAGNRAASRVLTRWAAHPDKDKKGVLLPDEMAGEFVKFNPPLSK
jgi:hypothetical protein